MKKKLIDEITKGVNRICFGDKFRKAFTEKFKHCPAGLTYHVNDYDGIEFIPTIKIYGYEHHSNNGVSDYTDLNDFDIGNTNLITKEHEKFMYDYFKHYETEFFSKYMVDATIL